MTQSPPTRLVDDPDVADPIREHLRAAIDSPPPPPLPIDDGAADLAQRIASDGGASSLLKIVAGVLGVGGIGVAAWLVATAPEPSAPPVEPATATVATQRMDAPSPPEEPAPPPTGDSPIEPEPEPEDTSPARTDASTRPATSSGAKPQRAAKREASGQADSLREIRLLREARRAATTDPGKAWSLLREIERDFPRGLMVEEREALAVEVLDRLGRDDEARRRGQSFLKRHPHSPSTQRVRDLITKKAPAP